MLGAIRHAGITVRKQSSDMGTVMKLQTPDSRLRREPFFRVVHLFELLEDEAWWTTSVNFQRRHSVFADEGVQWRVSFNLHAVRLRNARGFAVEFKSVINLWPEHLTKGKDVSLGRRRWYERLQRRLRHYGYRGRWGHSPYGRYGLFEKSLKNAKTVAAEVKVLDRVRRDFQMDGDELREAKAFLARKSPTASRSGKKHTERSRAATTTT